MDQGNVLNCVLKQIQHMDYCLGEYRLEHNLFYVFDRKECKTFVFPHCAVFVCVAVVYSLPDHGRRKGRSRGAWYLLDLKFEIFPSNFQQIRLFS